MINRRWAVGVGLMVVVVVWWTRKRNEKKLNNKKMTLSLLKRQLSSAGIY